MKWEPVEMASSYTVQFRHTSPDGQQQDWAQLPPVKGTVVRKKNLDPASVYYFRVLPVLEAEHDPWAPSPPSEAAVLPRLPALLRGLLGPTLVDAAGREVPVDSLAGHTVGVYASASWCGPCRQFTPSLAAFYEQARASGRAFQVVLVSCDRDAAAAAAYLAKMPWLAVPYASPAREAALKELQVPLAPHAAAQPMGEGGSPRGGRQAREKTLKRVAETVNAWVFYRRQVQGVPRPVTAAARRLSCAFALQVQGIPRLVVVAPDGRISHANAAQAPLTLQQLDAWARPPPDTPPPPPPPCAQPQCCGGGCR